MPNVVGMDGMPDRNPVRTVTNSFFVYSDFEIDVPALQSCLSRIFGVPVETVFVVEEILSELEDSVKVVCQWDAFKGDFRLRLNIFTLDGVPPVEEMTAILQMCSDLKCRCLVDNGETTPYDFLLVDEVGQITPVNLDAELLDDEENQQLVLATD